MHEVRIVNLDGALPLPTYARPGDAAVDLVARKEVEIPAAGGRVRVATGIAIELPEGTCALVLPRSGLAANHGITCLNTPGLIDSGYRGEIQVILLNTDPSESYLVHRGDRIAQLLVLEIEQVRFVATEELSSSERGQSGFGGSGR